MNLISRNNSADSNGAVKNVTVMSSRQRLSTLSSLLSAAFYSFVVSSSFTIERLPEGGEGMHGFDDGEGDD